MIKVCPACQKPFLAKKAKQQSCSLSCAASLGKAQKASHASLAKFEKVLWSSAECEQLAKLAGEMPFPELYQCFSSWAKENNFPVRSEITVKRRISILGLSRKPIFDNWTPSELAKLLQTKEINVYRWIKKGWLKARKVQDAFWAVSATDFAEFCLNHPKQTKLLNPFVLHLIKDKAKKMANSKPPDRAS